MTRTVNRASLVACKPFPRTTGGWVVRVVGLYTDQTGDARTDGWEVAVFHANSSDEVVELARLFIAAAHGGA